MGILMHLSVCILEDAACRNLYGNGEVRLPFMGTSVIPLHSLRLQVVYNRLEFGLCIPKSYFPFVAMILSA